MLGAAHAERHVGAGLDAGREATSPSPRRQINPAANPPVVIPRGQTEYKINPFGFGAAQAEPFLRLLMFKMGRKNSI